MVFDGREIIGKLKVLGPTRDSPALRLRLAARLGNASLRPAGMPPSAILVVKKLTHSMTGNPAWDSASLHDPHWENALRTWVRASWAGAARPSQGSVPGNAEAVCFADEGEMLACLSLDILAGTSGKWVWEQVRRGLPASARAGISGLWKSKPAILPALIANLHAWAKLAPALSSLSAEAALGLAADMAEAHGVKSPLFSGGNRRSQGRKSGSGIAEGVPVEAGSAVDGADPWGGLPKDLSWVTHGLPEHGLLAGLAWMIRHRPGTVLGRAFSRALSEWSPRSENTARTIDPSFPGPYGNHPARMAGQADASERHSVSLSETRRQGDGADTQSSSGAMAGAEGMSPPIESPAGSATGSRAEATAAKAESPSGKPLKGGNGSAEGAPPQNRLFMHSERPPANPPAHAPDAAEPYLSASLDPVADNKTASVRIASEGGPGPDFQAAFQTAQAEALDTGDSSPASPTRAAEAASEELPAGIRTRLAGVFYLINAMLEWQWVEGMRAAGNGEALGAWDWLELLARALLDGMDRREESVPSPFEADDPLWALLADLAGRESGALPLLAQSTLSDSNADSDAGANAEPLSGPFTAGLAWDTRIMLGRLFPGLRARLAGIFPHSNLQDIVPGMLRLEGVVHSGAAHVDVMLRMADIRIPVRFAGLDRNPGWAQEFGKVIYFHFD